MKSDLLLRPMWHQLSGRVQAHVFACVLAYALWKALDHMLRQTGMLTRVGKHDACQERASSTDRPLSSAVALLILHDVHIDGILLSTVDGRELRLRRVARPNAEQAELLVSLKLTPPERICADREMTDPQAVGLPFE